MTNVNVNLSEGLQSEKTAEIVPSEKLTFENMPKTDEELKALVTKFVEEKKLALHAFRDSYGIDEATIFSIINGVHYGMQFARAIKLIHAIHFGKVVPGKRKNKNIVVPA